ncbi:MULTISPECIES: hypothetical protein [Sphingosinicellaceae]|uniref:hypothetical protein n=1 Tax=Sphingosinicellaceae TaxID=2820280 RepID=UPI001C1E6EC5|nr:MULTISPECIES: hypothetical protein [Polymorphobacter]QYE36231.1 hypothetical protein KZX46_10010 [Polymorphobacter sp. PAMC 29334]UAJ10196.1 hypothetical protein KTC28_18380 [Polymorphobacter megasporae]
MIARVWHGWTTPANAAAYQHLLLTEVIPGIEHRCIAGFLQIDVLRRDDGDAVEFTTVMAFDTIEAIERFIGPDTTLAHIPAAARALLLHCDERAVHHDMLERRIQVEPSRGRT